MNFENGLKKLGGWTKGVIAFVVSLISFILLIKSNINLGLLLLSLTLLLGAVFWMVIIIASKKQPKYGPPFEQSKPEWKYQKYQRVWTLAILSFLIIFSVAVFIKWMRPLTVFVKYSFMNDPLLRPSELLQCYTTSSDILILVADFPGPQPDNYGVMDILIPSLLDNINSETVEILFIDKPIREKQGSSYATAIRDDCGATMIMWGWYLATDSDALLTVHFENMIDFSEMYQMDFGDYELRTDISHLENFALQVQAASDIPTLTSFINGFVCFGNEDYSTAIEYFSKALDNDAADKLLSKDIAFYYRGNSYYYLNQFTDAISDFDQALNLSSEGAIKGRIFVNRGNAFHNVGNFYEAVEDFTNSINHFTENTDKAIAYISRGNAYHYLGQAQLAINDYDNAIQILNDGELKAAVYINRGLVHYSNGAHQQAINDNNSALSMLADDLMKSIAYVNRGNSYDELGEFEQAINDYNSSIKLDPTNIGAYNNRGWAYYKMNQYNKAILDFQHTISSFPDGWRKANSYYYMGNAHMAISDYLTAIDDFDKSIGLFANYPTTIDPFCKNGLLIASLPEMEIVIDYEGVGEINIPYYDYDSFLRIFPNCSHFVAALYKQADIYFSLGQYQLAIEKFTETLDLLLSDNDSSSFIKPPEGSCISGLLTATPAPFEWCITSGIVAKMYFYRGIAYDQLEEYEKTLSDYDKAIEYFPDGWWKAATYNNKGNIYDHLGDLDQAVYNYTKALEFYSSEKDKGLAYFNRGRTYFYLENYDQAFRDLDQAISVSIEGETPYLSSAYYFRGMTNKEIGNASDAVSDLLKYLEFVPDAHDRFAIYDLISQLEDEMENDK